MISIPSNPNIGDTLILDGISYRYNGVAYDIDLTNLPSKSNLANNDQIIIQDSEDNEDFKKVSIVGALNNDEEWI